MQYFETIRQEGYVYVDKTDLVWKIANTDQNNFLSRPRRFGKSLLSDTLACYLEGRKDLFEGLKIMSLEKEWKKHFVFRFDFSGIQTAQQLKNHLEGTLSEYEQQLGRSSMVEIGDRFLALMKRAYEQTGEKFAVIIDEYDVPLQQTLYDNDEHDKVVAIYRSFFPTLKTGSQHLKCLFFTGITKFTQLSLFSTLNNVSILSAMPEYATVCGFTHQELLDNFMPEIEAMSLKKGWDTEETIATLRDMYDGYHFSEDTSPETAVYNPYSLINALADRRIGNYWVSSGGSSLLNKMLQRSDQEDIPIDGAEIDADTLELADVSLDNIPLFLYQSGYLTIKNYDDEIYTLTIPNKEVRRALYKIVLPNALQRQTDTVSGFVSNMKTALGKGDIEECMRRLQLLVAETPYARKGEMALEDRYRFILKHAFYLAGCNVEEEKQVNGGIIDLVAHFRKITLVIELKLETNGGLEAAKAQLATNDYAAAFTEPGREVYAVAIEAGSKHRGIIDYDIQRV